MSGYSFRQFHIPERMMAPLLAYIERGELPGDFLQAVLRNDFQRAALLADDENAANLPAYAGYLYNEAPVVCYGSAEIVAEWVARRAQKVAA
ncbi:MAG: hypothetical protein ACPHN2_08845 [Sinimarinibacterium flocculans]|uniref:hypothetical protein n=1 Tax=Sinimarinibacterium flocculans TaxID=985250 RepID=UPI003C683AE3